MSRSKIMRNMRNILSGVALVLILAGCGGQGREAAEMTIVDILPETAESGERRETEAIPEKSRIEEVSNAEPLLENTVEETVEKSQSDSDRVQEGLQEGLQEDPVEKPSEESLVSHPSTGRLVVIDAGHQAHGNSGKEPIGPGAEEKKAKVASGTRGTVSGLYEYELTLAVSEKLCAELESRGYSVLMVRTTHDVDISNAERAEMANNAGADVFIRVHANGSENGKVNGVETLCQTKNNPYNAGLYEDSRDLSSKVLDGVVNATGAVKRCVVETDTMSGINWCQVPVTIVEMGFMTNQEEDALMATEEYQQKIAVGIADGIDAYFGE